MKSFYLFLLSGFAASLHSGAQDSVPTRYRDAVYTDVSVTKNISYVQVVPKGADKKSYYFDLYQADSGTIEKRPLIIWMHGGGFKFQSKEASGTQLWCNDFAKRGYVCAAINYRLSKKNTLFNFKALVGGCADAVTDARQAIIYFKKNAAQYKIDTNCIILAGNSAGGMIALQAAYSKPSEMAKLAEDSSLDQPEQDPGKIAGIINFWGAIFKIEWLKNAVVPIVSVHGQLDTTVPIDHKGSVFYGSIPIHEEADTLHIPNELKIYKDYSHELEKKFNPFFASSGAKKRWQEAGDFAAGFLFSNVIRQTYGSISSR